jgi:hypothetical protein
MNLTAVVMLEVFISHSFLAVRSVGLMLVGSIGWENQQLPAITGRYPACGRSQAEHSSSGGA